MIEVTERQSQSVLCGHRICTHTFSEMTKLLALHVQIIV